MRRRKKSIVAISLEMQMSESTVNRHLSEIKKKIEEEKRYESGINPP